MKTNMPLTITAVLIFLSVGCSSVPSPIYSFTAYTPSSTKFTDVRFEFETQGGRMYSGSFGRVYPEMYARRSVLPRPIPQTAQVTWRTPDGELHKQEVEIAPKVQDPESFEGTFWLRLSPESVTVIPMTRKQMRERARQGGPLWPD